MKVTLNQLKEVDNNLTVKDNQLLMYIETEWLCISNTRWDTREEFEEEKEERGISGLNYGDDDNGGFTYLEFFPNDEDGCDKRREERNRTYVPEQGVEGEMCRLVNSSWGVLVTFPTSEINPDEEYEIEWELIDGEGFTPDKIYHIIDHSYDNYTYTIWEEGKGIIEKE